MNSKKTIIVDVLNQLYRYEERACLAYNTLSEKLHDEETIQFFSTIALEEQKHMDIVQNLIRLCSENDPS